MDRAYRLTEKQDIKPENETPEEPTAKKNRKASIISKIAILDNGTMVESFKYFNYCQLAKNSLVSKRFLDVIQTHRHRFALLYVYSIRMERCRYWDKIPAVTKIFNKELSLAEYNEWIVRNNYSKQIPLNRFGANVPPYYELDAYGDYKGPNRVRTSVFFARIEENNTEA